MKTLPFTYLAKGKYWYFRSPGFPQTRIQGEPHSPDFMWHYRQLMAQSGAASRVKASRNRQRKRALRGADARSVVYFIGSGEGRPIKIGRASDVRQRLAVLQNGSFEQLTILATVPGGVDVEREFHARFADLRMRGEWFEPGEALLATVAELSGTNRGTANPVKESAKHA